MQRYLLKSKGTYGRFRLALAGHCRDRGFSLIELLLVLMLLSILAATAVIVYSKFIYKSKETIVISHLHRIIKAQEMYMTDHDRYTDNFAELDVPGTVLPGENKNTLLYEGYKYILTLTGGTDKEAGWYVRAEPQDGNREIRWFYADQTGVIRYEIGTTAGPDSPSI